MGRVTGLTMIWDSWARAQCYLLFPAVTLYATMAPLPTNRSEYCCCPQLDNWVKKIPVWWNTKLEIYQGQTGKSALRLFTSFVCCSLFRQYLLWIEAIGGWKIGLEFNLLFKKGPRTRAGSEEALQDWIMSANLTVNGHTLKGKEFNTLHSIFMTNQIK